MVIKSGPFALMGGGVHVHPVLPPGYGPVFSKLCNLDGSRRMEIWIPSIKEFNNMPELIPIKGHIKFSRFHKWPSYYAMST